MSIPSTKRVAIITGAAGSLGRELVLAAAQTGWEIVMIDKDKRALERLYDQVVEAGGEEPAIQVLDLASMSPGDCEAIMTALESGPGQLDALIHCAASFDGLQPSDQIAPHDWLRHVQVNLNAPWLLSVSCLPLLRQSPAASLFFLVEDLRKVAGAFWGPFGICKHGIDALAAQLSAELSNTNIQVLSINPGSFRSLLRARVHHSEDPGGISDAVVPATKILHLLERASNPISFRVDLQSLELSDISND